MRKVAAIIPTPAKTDPAWRKTRPVPRAVRKMASRTAPLSSLAKTKVNATPAAAIKSFVMGSSRWSHVSAGTYRLTRMRSVPYDRPLIIAALATAHPARTKRSRKLQSLHLVPAACKQAGQALGQGPEDQVGDDYGGQLVRDVHDQLVQERSDPDGPTIADEVRIERVAPDVAGLAFPQDDVDRRRHHRGHDADDEAEPDRAAEGGNPAGKGQVAHDEADGDAGDEVPERNRVGGQTEYDVAGGARDRPAPGRCQQGRQHSAD